MTLLHHGSNSRLHYYATALFRDGSGQAPVDGAQQHSWDYNNHGELNAVNTTNRMHAEFDNDVPPSFVLHIGDIAYVI